MFELLIRSISRNKAHIVSFDHFSVYKMSQRRKCVFFGVTKVLPRNVLPSFKDVIQHYLHLNNKLGITQVS